MQMRAEGQLLMFSGGERSAVYSQTQVTPFSGLIKEIKDSTVLDVLIWLRDQTRLF